MFFDTIFNGLFMEDVSNSNSDSDSHSNSNSNGNDNRGSDFSFRTMKKRKEHAKERKEMEKFVSDCRHSKKE